MASPTAIDPDPEASPADRRISRPWILAAILLLAAVLRINNITQPFVDAFGWRQTSTAMIARNYTTHNPNIFYPEVDWSGPGPSYQGREFQTVSYMASLLYRAFGYHDWLARAVPITFSLWGIFALFHLVRRVWGEGHGLAAAAVMTLLPGGIFIDRSFLPDPAMVALMVTACWMLLAYLQDGRTRHLVIAAATASLGMLTKLPGAIVALPMLYAAFETLGYRRLIGRKVWRPLLVAGLVAVTPVVVYYLWARHLAMSYPPHHFAGSGNWVWVYGFGDWIRQRYFIPRAMGNFLYWLWTPPVMALFALGLLFGPPRTRRGRQRHAETAPGEVREKHREAPWFFHVWLLGALFFYLIGAKELVDNPWNFHIFNPAIAAIAARGMFGVASFAEHAVRRGQAFTRTFVLRSVAILAVVLVAGQIELGNMYHSQGSQAYWMGRHLSSIAAPEDLVITVANDIGDPVAIYYSGRRGWTFPPPDHSYDWSQWPADDNVSVRMLDDLIRKGADWFAIVDERSEFWTDHPLLVDHLKRNAVVAVKNPDWIIYNIRSAGESPEQGS